MMKTPVPNQSIDGSVTYQNFIQMGAMKENLVQSKSVVEEKQKQDGKGQREDLSRVQFQGQAYLKGPAPLQSLPPGAQCQRCRCMLPQQFLRVKQQLIKLQNTLLEQKDKNCRLKQSYTDQSNTKIRELQEYIDKLHDQTSIKSLVLQLQELKDKENNSIVCITQLSDQNTRLQREFQKLMLKFTDLKQKSKLFSHNDSRTKGMSRISNQSRFDLDISGFDDYSQTHKSNSYINQLEESNIWLKKENKRLTEIITQGLRCRG